MGDFADKQTEEHLYCVDNSIDITYSSLSSQEMEEGRNYWISQIREILPGFDCEAICNQLCKKFPAYNYINTCISRFQLLLDILLSLPRNERTDILISLPQDDLEVLSKCKKEQTFYRKEAVAVCMEAFQVQQIREVTKSPEKRLEELNEIRKKDKVKPIEGRNKKGDAYVEEKILEVRTRGKRLVSNMALENFEYYLAGSGETKVYDPDMMRKFSFIRDAEEINQDRFVSQTIPNVLSGNSKWLNGEIVEFADVWKNAIEEKDMFLSTLHSSFILLRDVYIRKEKPYTRNLDFYCAFGPSTVISTGHFSAEIVNRKLVKISGIVRHEFNDIYDFHGDKGIPVIGGDDAFAYAGIFLGAKPYLMLSVWEVLFEGWYDPEKKEWILEPKWMDTESYVPLNIQEQDTMSK
jgi:hypothetical protein